MKLYCLGDSLTFGYGVHPAKRWISVSARESGWDARNLGVCGDTTSGMLVRLHTQLKPELKPGDHVLVMGGSNDILYGGSSESARTNLGAMVHQLLSWRMKPIVGVPLPIRAEDVPEKWAALTDMEQATQLLADYRAWCRRFCRTFDIPVVDFDTDFMTAEGAAEASLLFDGIHPGVEGHRLMADRLIDILHGLESGK